MCTRPLPSTASLTCRSLGLPPPPAGRLWLLFTAAARMMHFKARPLGELSAELTERDKNNKILYFHAPPCHPERSRNPSETRIERCFHRSGSRRKTQRKFIRDPASRPPLSRVRLRKIHTVNFSSLRMTRTRFVWLDLRQTAGEIHST